MRLFYPDLTAVGLLAVMLGVSYGLLGLALGVGQWLLFLFNLWLGTLMEESRVQVADVLVARSTVHRVQHDPVRHRFVPVLAVH